MPFGFLDDFAVLEAKSSHLILVLLWICGIAEGLLVPKAEMGKNMVAGRKIPSQICVDSQTNRLIGVNKYRDFIFFDAPD